MRAFPDFAWAVGEEGSDPWVEGKDGKRESVEVKALAKPLATPPAMANKPAPATEHKH